MRGYGRGSPMPVTHLMLLDQPGNPRFACGRGVLEAAAAKEGATSSPADLTCPACYEKIFLPQADDPAERSASSITD